MQWQYPFSVKLAVNNITMSTTVQIIVCPCFVSVTAFDIRLKSQWTLILLKLTYNYGSTTVHWSPSDNLASWSVLHVAVPRTKKIRVGGVAASWFVPLRQLSGGQESIRPRICLIPRMSMCNQRIQDQAADNLPLWPGWCCRRVSSCNQYFSFRPLVRGFWWFYFVVERFERYYVAFGDWSARLILIFHVCFLNTILLFCPLFVWLCCSLPYWQINVTIIRAFHRRRMETMTNCLKVGSGETPSWGVTSLSDDTL